ncbi:chitinase [Streptoalloteichus tenebrarius]|uniref:Chitinase n=1 Tax=Streptoalloteichus tenebrarius (strain ATCC 17920 / DSM 40477 / JCM 4838 / CBS 697.72 / NBRC 16177 / NCIMB 11028 / NRRL B-12390 / A12253. 1 / ISP 5477) TaxID=1933 RepID=A0ABT1HRR4_STRSD|nr:chitinase [Streptoalloteichus tenebrarius]MCP2258207.1 chitinase [Streptoalloteichus tenebrarius]BFF04564.1 hypothetical protein GCM10020241_62390 [Streptoalloteichus tenebrarius]
MRQRHTRPSRERRARHVRGGLSRLAVLLLLGGVTANCERGGDPPAEQRPRARFAPYVEVTSSRPNLLEVLDATGQRDFTLAFVRADGHRCSVVWDGGLPLRDPGLLHEIDALTARGGSVTVATGGANGPYLEHHCATPEDLAATYRQALDAVGTNRLDVDIEEDVPAERVNQALGLLRRERGTTVTYTLPATRDGLEPRALSLLADAAGRGLEVSVNAMVMNFGRDAAQGDAAQGDAMLASARRVVDQLHRIWPDRAPEWVHQRLGLTPMIGRNDDGTVTTADDARRLRAFADQHGVGHLGFWSLARDNGRCPGRADAASDCSGIEQSPYEFTRILAHAQRDGGG